jgi:site-specific recombinase XerD
MASGKTLALLFYIRNDKIRKDKRVPIYLRITVDGKRHEFAVKRFIKPDSWNNETGYGRGTRDEIKQLNTYLDILRAKVYQYHKELVEEDIAVTSEAIKNKLLGKGKYERTLIETFEYHNNLLSEKVGIDHAPATYKRYETTLKHINDFLKSKYQTDDLLLKNLDHEFITDLEHYFKTIRKCNHNTTAKYIKNLRKVVNLALKNDWLIKDPFRAFQMNIREVPRDFLNEDELHSIEFKELNILRLDIVRDVFVFCCYTGLAFVDVSKLAPDNIVTGIDGEKWIFINRTKTNIPSKIPILPKAQEIIDKYKNFPLNTIKGKLLPVMSNQKQNAYLKEIADICGVQKHLSFHSSRHTFATTVTLLNGVSIESVSSMLGHKNIRTTQIYAKVVEKKLSVDMKMLKTKLINQSESQKTKNGA